MLKDESPSERIETALASPSPIEALRAYAMELSSSGVGRAQILKIFFNHHKILQATNREAEENILGDILDMLTGCYSGRNLDLPE